MANLHLLFKQDERSNEDEETQRARHLVDLRIEVDTLTEKIKSSPDSAYPDFLFNPMTNEFDNDNYRVRGIASDDASKAVSMLKRKYADYFDYLDAIDIYENYIDHLIDKYGTFEIVQFGVRDGLIQEILPERPKLKDKKANRILSEMGVVPSEKVLPPKDPEVIRLMAEEIYPLDTGEELRGTLIYDSIPKDMRKTVRESFHKNRMLARKSTIYQKYNANAALNAIADFMRSHDSSYYDQKGKFRDLSVTEIIEEQHQYDGMDPELVEIITRPNTQIIKNGRLVDPAMEDTIDIFKSLAEEGFDALQNASKHMSKTAVRMIRSSVSPYSDGPMTKKQLKKFKKRQKKEEKEFYESMAADDRMRELLTQNKVSFTRDGSSLSWKLSDAFPDDDD